jgi:two-component system LytT family response regulator
MVDSERSASHAITAAIVDDERLSREAIRLRVAAEADFLIVGEAADGAEAIRLITSARPDVVFLDIHMADVDGFEVIAQVSPVHLPIVVFVTAHDRFAVQAFERHALDYLLKPFSSSRFASMLARVRREVAKTGEEETHRPLMAVLDERQAGRHRVETRAAETSAEPYLIRFAVQRNGRIVLVRVDDVDWIESCANYARLHVGSTSHLVRLTMAELERRLDPSRFVRIHRSAIVRIDRVESIVPAMRGDFTVTLRDSPVELRLSRTYRNRLQR